MRWVVYILQCNDGSLYTGITSNLERRFQEHKEGKGGRYTSSHKPLIVEYSEHFATRGDALKRERQIKGWSRQKKENLIKGLPA
mgnify:CR=1 FL=1